MGQTPIEWVRRFGRPGFTVNPIRFRNLSTGKVGHYCEKISPGCKFCYADAMQTGPYLSGLPFLPESFGKGELFLDHDVLDQVLSRRKPTAYFWCDMTDLFGHWVPFEWIDEIIATMVAAPQHRHMILTKRDERALEYFTSGRQYRGNGPDRATVHLDDEDLVPVALRRPSTPRLDIWIGVSCEDRARKSRLDTLRKIPATHRFVSFEPLLEDLELGARDFRGIELAIWGGESGGKARDCYAEWIHHGMAVARSGGAKNFVKQLGRRPCERPGVIFADKHGPMKRPSRIWPSHTATRTRSNGLVEIQLDNKKGGDPAEWPAALQVRELPE
jgi:protein gp37